MKEKFREFSEKHRHLIVISLIIAVILAALTPLLVPLGMELEEIITSPIRIEKGEKASIWIRCMEHEYLPLEVREIYDYFCAITYTGENFLAVRDAMIRAPGEEAEKALKLPMLLEIVTEDDRAYTKSYHLSCANGSYFLSGVDRRGAVTMWHVSERAAQELLGYRLCQSSLFTQQPREKLLEEEAFDEISLSIREERTDSGFVALSPSQQASLRAFFAEQLPQVECTGGYPERLPNSKDGWTLMFLYADGSGWWLHYSDAPLFCLCLGVLRSGETEPDGVAKYQLEEDNVFAALPELLEESP